MPSSVSVRLAAVRSLRVLPSPFEGCGVEEGWERVAQCHVMTSATPHSARTAPGLDSWALSRIRYGGDSPFDPHARDVSGHLMLWLGGAVEMLWAEGEPPARRNTAQGAPVLQARRKATRGVSGPGARRKLTRVAPNPRAKQKSLGRSRPWAWSVSWPCLVWGVCLAIFVFERAISPVVRGPLMFVHNTCLNTMFTQDCKSRHACSKHYCKHESSIIKLHEMT
jgi:hypothetical protein